MDVRVGSRHGCSHGCLFVILIITVMQQGQAAGNDPPAMNFFAQPPDYTPAHAHANWFGQVRIW